MEHGGARPGAGRKSGGVNSRNLEIALKAADEGVTPLEYMLQVLRDETQPPELRMAAAKSAAPYIHPRLTCVELKGSDAKTHEDWVNEATERALAHEAAQRALAAEESQT